MRVPNYKESSFDHVRIKICHGMRSELAVFCERTINCLCECGRCVFRPILSENWSVWGPLYHCDIQNFITSRALEGTPDVQVIMRNIKVVKYVLNVRLFKVYKNQRTCYQTLQQYSLCHVSFCFGGCTFVDIFLRIVTARRNLNKFETFKLRNTAVKYNYNKI